VDVDKYYEEACASWVESVVEALKTSIALPEIAACSHR